MHDMPDLNMPSTPEAMAHIDALGLHGMREILAEWDIMPADMRLEIIEHADKEAEAGIALRRIAARQTDPTRAAFFASRAESCETIVRLIREKSLR